MTLSLEGLLCTKFLPGGLKNLLYNTNLHVKFQSFFGSPVGSLCCSGKCGQNLECHSVFCQRNCSLTASTTLDPKANHVWMKPSREK